MYNDKSYSIIQCCEYLQDQSDPTSEDDSLYEEELDPPKVLGDILESVAGAVFLDSGMNLNAVWSVFKHLFQKKIGMFYSFVSYLAGYEILFCCCFQMSLEERYQFFLFKSYMKWNRMQSALGMFGKLAMSCM